MKKPSTSDLIKKILDSYKFGSIKSWKRVSKKKNADNRIVRIFDNEQGGVRAIVTETEPGKFSFETQSLKKSFFAVSTKDMEEAARPKTLDDFIEKDPAKNAAAEKLITLLEGDDVTSIKNYKALVQEINAEHGTDLEKDYRKRDDIMDELAEKAGHRAINNRYYMGITIERREDSYYVYTTPVAFFNKKGHLSDQTGNVHVPGHWDAMESCFEGSPIKDIEKNFKELLESGLQWSPDFQKMVDDKNDQDLLNRLQAVYDKLNPPKASTPASNKPSTP